MNLYISADMEGVAGVCSWHQINARTPNSDYALYRRFFTEEILAAIAGARAGGAGDILLNDSHGPMRNVILDDLPDGVRVIFGNRKPFSMVQDAERSSGAFFVGYHGAVGEPNAALCHTYTPSVIYEARVNGIVCSEATLNAALLGQWGVPVLLITGDRTTVEGVQQTLPWVVGAVVKESIGQSCVNSLHPRAAQAVIQEAASQAVRLAAHAKPFVFAVPIELQIDVAAVEQADFIALIPGFARIGRRTVRFIHDDYAVVFKAFVAAFRLGAAATAPG
ncbi:MAG: M55 family metallopeptidase [Vulcanimicrobiaceae bacterium]